MRPHAGKIALFLVFALFAVGIGGCSSHTFVQTEPSLILGAQELSGYIGKDGVVIVDTRSADEYAAGHQRVLKCRKNTSRWGHPVFSGPCLCTATETSKWWTAGLTR